MRIPRKFETNHSDASPELIAWMVNNGWTLESRIAETPRRVHVSLSFGCQTVVFKCTQETLDEAQRLALEEEAK